MTHGSLFSGIGGAELAASWMGWENIFHCEINKYCQKLLKQHFPESIGYEDIKTTDFTIWRGKIDIVTGGFPCQPFSTAGKRKGTADDRYLWPEMLRAITEIQPHWVVGENVPGLINWSKGLVFEQVQADLEAAGFEVFPPCVLPACGQDAPHRRERIWIVAHSNSNGWIRNKIPQKRFEYSSEERKTFGFVDSSDGGRVAPDTNLQGLQGGPSKRNRTYGERGEDSKIRPTRSSKRYDWGGWKMFPTQPPICGRNDGIPNRVDRIKGLGNAWVPQVAYQIFKAIEQFESIEPTK